MENDAFNRESVRRKERQTNDLKNILAEKLHSKFVNSTPSLIQQLPLSLLYPFGLLFNSFFIALFIGFLVSGYQSNVNTPFLALPLAASGSICSEVPVSVTGTFMATLDGHWEGSPDFNYRQAAFRFSAKSFMSSSEDYEKNGAQLFSYILSVSGAASGENVAYNLVMWMTVYVAFGKASRFSLMGSPNVVFNREHTTGMIANGAGICDVPSVTKFDVTTSKFTMTLDVQAYNKSAQCQSLFPLALTGYEPLADVNDVKILFDVRSMIMAVGINFGIVNLFDLEFVPNLIQTIELYGYNFDIYPVYNPLYPNMDLIYCTVVVSESGAFPVCVVRVGKAYALPLFNHKGRSMYRPEYCDCNDKRFVEDGDVADCNNFHLMSSLLLWPEFSNATEVFRIIVNFLQYFSFKDGNYFVFNASFATSAWSNTNPDLYHSPAYLNEAFSFCGESTTECTLITFSSFDSSQYNFAISDFYYQMPSGFCNNTVKLSDEVRYVFEYFRVCCGVCGFFLG